MLLLEVRESLPFLRGGMGNKLLSRSGLKQCAIPFCVSLIRQIDGISGPCLFNDRENVHGQEKSFT